MDDVYPDRFYLMGNLHKQFIKVQRKTTNLMELILSFFSSRTMILPNIAG